MRIQDLKAQFDGYQPVRITPPGAKAAAVLIPLVESDGRVCILFEKRSREVRQGGEICFPGGLIEARRPSSPDFRAAPSGAQDLSVRAGFVSEAVKETEIGQPADTEATPETPAEAAVRETAEELLLPPDQIEVITPLHVISGPGGTEVTSFLGVLHGYDGTFSEAEVERTFLIPLDWFSAHPPEIHSARMRLETEEDFPYELIPGGRGYPMRTIPRRFYFYRTAYGVIWGMTAELLYHFLRSN